MSDLTLIYYTANRISDVFQNRVLDALDNTWLQINGEPATVVVSQKPIVYGGTHIVLGDIGASAYNVYRQILIGAKAATTKYVAMAEDDSLYVPEHFEFRPVDDRVFFYNRNRWVLTRRARENGQREGVFYFRERTQMAQLVCLRELLIETLEERFLKYPDPLPDDVTFKMGWGEPGRYEKNLGLPKRERAYFSTSQPNVTFNHSESIRGRRAIQATDTVVTDLAPWGNATALWDRVHG